MIGRWRVRTSRDDEDDAWRAETRRDEGGWTTNERARFLFWRGRGNNARDAQEAWTRETRREYVRRLIAAGRIGEGAP